MKPTIYTINLALLVCAMLTHIDAACAWGSEGHRITGYIAESLLTPKARIRVHQLTNGASLDQVATYMDEHKHDLGPRIRQWHYDNDPVCQVVPVESYCHQGNCASRQIERLIGVLESPTSNTEQKRRAVVFLAHLIGDIHQPLHAGDNGDRGGNDITVISEKSHGHHHSSLHEEWDSTFVKSLLRGHEEMTFAAQIVEQGKKHIEHYQRGNAADWRNESNMIARGVAYGQLPGFSCGIHLMTTRITPDYSYHARNIVQEQMLKAGARMAWVLNTAFAEAPSSPRSR